LSDYITQLTARQTRWVAAIR